MLVESFACEETSSEPPEASEAAVALIQSLGLQGQWSLVTTSNGRQSRLPFRQIRRDEDFVYRTLCPTSTTLEAYSSSPIPLRVLEIAEIAKSSGVFDKGLRVWDRADASVKDPVLVGLASVPNQTWGELTYILARWGEELESFPTLVQRALESWRAARRSALVSIQAQAAAALAVNDTLTIDDVAYLSTSRPVAYHLT